MIEFTALAMSTVYGPRQQAEGGVVAAFAAAHRDGQPPRFRRRRPPDPGSVVIDDAVDALVRSSERGSGLVINVGTGTQTTLRDLWAEISSGTGPAPESAPVRNDDLLRFAVSPVRARIHLGWSPWTELHDGLVQL